MPQPMKLTDAELDLIVTNEADQFIEAITANALYEKYGNRVLIVSKHQKLFGIWLHHYEIRLVERLQKQHIDRQNRIINGMVQLHQDDLKKAKRVATLAALTSLPMRKGRFGREYVDIKAVNRIVEGL